RSPQHGECFRRKRAVKRATIVLALLVATSAAAQDHRGSSSSERQPQSRSRNSYANPSAVIAAETAFARLAQEKGQWTAFAETAARDAVMFEPRMVYAQEWLKDRPNPPVAVRWQPHRVWSSCDGSLIVSHGAWQRANGTGWFTTIWQRQKDGGYKWVLDHGDSLAQPLAEPEMISALIADCPERRRRPDGKPPAKRPKVRNLPPLDPARREGKSDDGTLSWDVTVDAAGARSLSVTWKKDGASATALAQQVAAPPAATN
ncbi:MAG: hypothetical protein AB7F98_19300, partial [Novosphingobium sp.]